MASPPPRMASSPNSFHQDRKLSEKEAFYAEFGGSAFFEHAPPPRVTVAEARAGGEEELDLESGGDFTISRAPRVILADAGALNKDGGLVPVEEVKAGLEQRHIQMIALAGTIGTGLFLGSGKALAHGGPLGILIGYSAVGGIVIGMVLSLAEMSALVPVSGSYIRHASMWFDPALSFAAGWNMMLNQVISIPAEIVAGAVLFQWWTDVTPALFISILIVAIGVTNAFSVRFYGELEFAFAILKIVTIVGLIIFGICISLGAGPNADGPIGFRYWNDPGPLVEYLVPGGSGRFVGFWAVLTNSAYAFAFSETVAMAAAETKSPRRNVPLAAKRLFARVLIFYVLSVLVIGMIVPSNDSHLVNESKTTSASPFVVAARRAGVKVLPSVVNAVIITSAWSAANSGMLNGSRGLYGMALDEHAPAIFRRVGRWGVPYVAICLLLGFTPLAYMCLGSSATQVFGWLSATVSSITLVIWSTILCVYIRFNKGCQVQGIDRNQLPYKSPFQPYLAYFSLGFCQLVLFTQGFVVFLDGHWSTETFVCTYLAIPLFLATFFAYKYINGTRMVDPMQMRIAEFIQHAKDNPEPEPVYSRGALGAFQKFLYG